MKNSKLSSVRTKKSPAPEPSAEQVHFQAFLADADVTALEIIISDGIGTILVGGSDELYHAIEDLARRHGHRWVDSDIDDFVSANEFEAKQQTAFMIGIALGMRLHAARLLDSPTAVQR